MMTERKAKNQIIEAAKHLVENGLISRYSGNISCRIDNERFVVTTDEANFAKLSYKDIVVVNMDTMIYEGKIKPTDETYIHAYAYDLNLNNSFVIHSHQRYASCISVCGIKSFYPTDKQKELLGGNIKIVKEPVFGKPNLSRTARSALSKGLNVILIERHGAIITGHDMSAALNRAIALEHASKKSLNGLTFCDKPIEALSQRLDKKFFAYTIVEGTQEPKRLRINNRKLNAVELIHAKLLKAFQNENVVVCRNSVATDMAARQTEVVSALFDDFEKTIGVDIKIAPYYDVGKIIDGAKKRGGVIVKDIGVFVIAKNFSEGLARLEIIEKNLVAYVHKQKIVNLENLTINEKTLKTYTFKKKPLVETKTK